MKALFARWLAVRQVRRERWAHNAHLFGAPQRVPADPRQE